MKPTGSLFTFTTNKKICIQKTGPETLGLHEKKVPKRPCLI